MAGRMNTYAEFAENDYKFFRQSYDSGNKGSALAALGQSICERYLKHIISECAHPENESEAVSKESVLRTHSLRRLMRYISGWALIFRTKRKVHWTGSMDSILQRDIRGMTALFLQRGILTGRIKRCTCAGISCSRQ